LNYCPFFKLTKNLTQFCACSTTQEKNKKCKHLPQVKLLQTQTVLTSNDTNTKKQKLNKTTIANRTQKSNTQLNKSTIKNYNKPTTHKQLTITKHSQPNAIIKNEIDLKQSISNTTLFPKHIPVKQDIGKSGLMWPRALANFHSAAKLLHWYSDDGCPVDCGPNWSKQHIIEAVKRGPHKSAKIPEAKLYLQNETHHKVKEGFAKLVTWKQIKNSIPNNFKLSPVATVPHKSRDFRVILDLSFQLKINNKKLPSINSTTNKLAPQRAMANLGDVLRRIINMMASNHNLEQPFVFAKVDIKDGFWRLVINPKDAWNFCYVLPRHSKLTPLDDTQIVVPTCLQMGWCESPPYFYTATETARDIVKALIQHLQLPPHNMEHYMIPTPQSLPSSKNTSNKSDKDMAEVYVDDFICLTNNTSPDNLTQLARATLHRIHSIFPPPAVSGHIGGDPISEKKMKALDGLFATQNEILSWNFNGSDFTIQLPPSKVAKIHALIKTIAKQSRVNINQFQQLAGKLNHAAIGLPAGKGLFSPFYNCLHTMDIGYSGYKSNCSKIMALVVIQMCPKLPRLVHSI
jgi:hypothetical protein